MPSQVHLVTAALSLLFAASGAIMLGFSVIVKGNIAKGAPTDGQELARHLLYQRWPLDAGIANGVIILATFLVMVPGLLIPTRIWLKLSGVMVVISGIFTLCIGAIIWVQTLTTKADTFAIYSAQSSDAQSQIELAFSCCGYFNSTSPSFITNSVCTSPASAALQVGCATSLTTFINTFADTIFTAVFGMVGLDAVLIVSFACLLKERKDNERYRYIDQKTGYGGF